MLYITGTVLVAGVQMRRSPIQSIMTLWFF